ncbi:phosphotransferase [Priestia taiwanensis]|uniref:Protein kinase domain-containing protein n=1 Tax=Priestia taiwanensis TaxID=1347902 RepID=A0A917AMS1_9BACI|nr:phosphotransferase [Priestia taiwanensis]MBM7362215.1 aminoglycoside phosphotransferase (APT) family kinase protein [Priestia taiwanensis]GGE60345.1 hypothetical protein GCM10007140_08370 [Priestia taiwanensis]
MNSKIIDILREYPIQPIVQIAELKKGNTSRPILITTTNNTYVLRRIKDIKQAKTEFLISKALSEYKISSTIVETKNQLPYVHRIESVYNLQPYIKHDIVKREIDFEMLGKVILTFHDVIRSIEGIYEQPDRFALSDMWKELIHRNVEIQGGLYHIVEKCLAYEEDDTGYIHGDLGKWNLLFYGQDIYIIDFGEVRKGNQHFDLAAVITSTIDWQSNDSWMIHALQQFQRGYQGINWRMLKEQIDVWLIRGIVAMFIQDGVTSETKKYAKMLMNRRERLETIIMYHFLEKR